MSKENLLEMKKKKVIWERERERDDVIERENEKFTWDDNWKKLRD